MCLLDCLTHGCTQREVLDKLETISRRLTRIDHALQREEIIMSETTDAIAAVSAQLAEVDADLGRALADLVSAVEGKLTPEEAAAFTAVSDKLTAMKTEIDTADPEPATPEV